jgi:hypothetical protein
MLTYLPGDTVDDRTPWPTWVHSDSTLIQVGRWLRRVHDAKVSFAPRADERWFIGDTVRPGLIVGHQDAAPYNAVVDGDRLVSFCDWETAGPSSREFDLALSGPVVGAVLPAERGRAAGLPRLRRPIPPPSSPA